MFIRKGDGIISSVKDKIKIRTLGQDGYCRICNRTINRLEEEVITFHSRSRKGGNDILCKLCIKELNDVLNSLSGDRILKSIKEADDRKESCIRFVKWLDCDTIECKINKCGTYEFECGKDICVAYKSN